MGLDASLVANMSQTAAGRWSTLKDTFVTLAGKVTQPIFDTFSSGLGKINDWLTKNQDKIETFVGKLARISEIVAGGIGAAFAGDIAGVVQAGTQLGVPLETMQRLVEIFYTARDAALQFKDGVITALPEVWTVVQESLADMEPSFTRLKESFGKLGSAFADIGESMGLGESDNWLWMLEQVLNGIERQVKFIAGIMERISWAAQKTAEAIQIAIGLYNQISEITDWREKTGQFNYTGAGMPGVPGGAPATGASIPGAPGLVNLGQFADGGNFTVPGNGGGDQPFLIGLTPGEQVDVTPAGGGGQTSVSIPIQLDGQTIANYVLRLAGGRVVEMSRFGGTAAM
jgi:truncated hemoglobin YjbI